MNECGKSTQATYQTTSLENLKVASNIKLKYTKSEKETRHYRKKKFRVEGCQFKGYHHNAVQVSEETGITRDLPSIGT